MERNAKAHWTHTYLKRINSTEVTVRKEKSLPKRESKPRAQTAPVLSRREAEPRGQRTPDRVLGTPVKAVCYLTPNKHLTIPQTPNSTATDNCMSIRSKKRLFW
ncbi:hypothetical protein NECID01_1567 [Nematocida sp. AWRm77]|nr:hypothetical protein NECID01_1567 [Nematocida sp. AWRm77]